MQTDYESLGDILNLPDDKFDELMDHFRMEGDGGADGVDADDLMEKVLEHEFRIPRSQKRFQRHGYNRLLTIADKLVESPELALRRDSHVSTLLDEVPAEARNYFHPLGTPDWVKPELLDVAGEVWDLNVVAMLMVLYSSSLPSCYFIKRGIPALYDSKKLANPNYVGQRLYETALMLDDVMASGGVQVIKDAKLDEDQLMHDVLHEVVGDGWQKLGGEIHIDPDHELTKGREFVEVGREIYEKLENAREAVGSPTYIWGRGFISARKVRALHSSMRYMFLNPKRIHDHLKGQSADGGANGEVETKNPIHYQTDLLQKARHGILEWNLEENGKPINQEDQAFTMLTFSYLLPRGVCHWGCPLSAEQKHAFLHLWKVVAYSMGLRTELTTDNWEEAEELYRRLLIRQAGSSPDGEKLTHTVLEFAGGFMPTALGVNKWFPMKMMVDQTRQDTAIFRDIEDGDDPPAVLVGKKKVEECCGFGPNVLYVVFRCLVWLFYKVGVLVLLKIPGVKGLTRKLICSSGRALYRSFRGEYLRKPFYVPMTSTRWVLSPGATPAFQGRVKCWRRRLFARILAGLASLVLFTVSLVTFVVLFTVKIPEVLLGAGGLMLHPIRHREDVPAMHEKLQHHLDVIGWEMLGLGTAAVVFAILGCWILLRVVPRFVRLRPDLEEDAFSVAKDALEPEQSLEFGREAVEARKQAEKERCRAPMRQRLRSRK